ncbi:MAG TPA: metallophosphoesterase family protein [Candidatus Dormibacteraeota bacterium]|nr:metallophosphoesterase family protein [Candidatus Dormibacteraeota bacterium]
MVVRLLAVSDEVEPQLLDERTVEAQGRIDLVIGCGDLPADYLDTLSTIYAAPLVFVRGNHDPPDRQGDYPQSAEIDGRVVRERGLLIAGLEGSIRYSDGAHQYTERQMMAKVRALRLRLRLRHPDILITHGPPAGVNEGTDAPHRGLQAVRRAVEWMRPRLLLHGHVHPYGREIPREGQLGETRVINVVGHRLIELAAR